MEFPGKKKMDTFSRVKRPKFFLCRCVRVTEGPHGDAVRTPLLAVRRSLATCALQLQKHGDGERTRKNNVRCSGNKKMAPPAYVSSRQRTVQTLPTVRIAIRTPHNEGTVTVRSSGVNRYTRRPQNMSARSSYRPPAPVGAATPVHSALGGGGGGSSGR